MLSHRRRSDTSPRQISAKADEAAKFHSLKENPNRVHGTSSQCATGLVDNAVVTSDRFIGWDRSSPVQPRVPVHQPCSTPAW